MPTNTYRKGDYTFYFKTSPRGYIEWARVFKRGDRNKEGRLIFQLTPIPGQEPEPTWPMTKRALLDIMIDIGMESERAEAHRRGELADEYLRRDESTADSELKYTIGYDEDYVNNLDLETLISMYDLSLLSKDVMGDMLLEYVSGQRRRQ